MSTDLVQSCADQSAVVYRRCCWRKFPWLARCPMALLFLDVGECTCPSMLEHRRGDPWLHQLEVGQCVLASSLIGSHDRRTVSVSLFETLSIISRWILRRRMLRHALSTRLITACAQCNGRVWSRLPWQPSSCCYSLETRSSSD